MQNKKLITVAEAAAILGRSKSAIYAALNGSPPRLHYHDRSKRLILRDGLEARFARSTRPRIDRPQAKAPEVASVSEWDEVARLCNSWIDFDLWGPGPWPADRWISLANVIHMALQEVASDAP